MGSRGPRPKRSRQDPSKDRSRQQEFTTLEADGIPRGPELPDMDWPEQTRRWWHAWRTSAQAQAFTATDWDFLLDTALLHRALWLGDTRVAGELRLRLARMGATETDRDRLRWLVDQPEQHPAARDPRARREHVLHLIAKKGSTDDD